MPTLQLADLWRESGRYDAYGRKCCASRIGMNARCYMADQRGDDHGNLPGYVRSYRDLPKILYHIQWKFRDEQRPRFGVMRGANS